MAIILDGHGIAAISLLLLAFRRMHRWQTGAQVKCAHRPGTQVSARELSSGRHPRQILCAWIPWASSSPGRRGLRSDWRPLNRKGDREEVERFGLAHLTFPPPRSVPPVAFSLILLHLRQRLRGLRPGLVPHGPEALPSRRGPQYAFSRFSIQHTFFRHKKLLACALPIRLSQRCKGSRACAWRPCSSSPCV